MDTKKVWLVTGASKGLGLSLVKKLLNEGYKVVATSRTVERLEKEVGTSANFLPLEVIITDEQSVKNAIAKIVTVFGTIDVVVNNAGYGQLGALEELSDKEARQNFDVNVFGSLNVIRSVMPHLRERKKGIIINIASIGGFTGAFPGWGIYCSTKFAVVGFTEALAEEIKEFGVSATVVYPGYFRTSFLDNGSLNLPNQPLMEYKAARASEEWHKNEQSGHQPGSPEKAAEVLIQLAEMENLPLHFMMGSDAFRIAQDKIEALKITLKDNENLTKLTDF
tara:strand:+ start:29223 stop:30059 length:837 start_codon:yes stop_codon:yes gene_type:complete